MLHLVRIVGKKRDSKVDNAKTLPQDYDGLDPFPTDDTPYPTQPNRVSVLHERGKEGMRHSGLKRADRRTIWFTQLKHTSLQ